MNPVARESPTAPGRERSSFGAERLALVARLEDSHFWFSGRRALVERLLERHVPDRVAAALEVGCGTGSFLPVLARRAERIVGLDALADGSGTIVHGDVEQLPFEAASFDLVVALDVLEHVDETAVDELSRVLRPGGVAIVTVPALPWLWSVRDELAGHRRRYCRSDLLRTLESSGLQVKETAFYQFLLLPLVLLSRAIARRRPGTIVHEEDVPAVLNRLFALVNALEVRLGSRIRWPAGSTLAVVARKSEQ